MAKILVCVSNSIYVDDKYRIACFYEQFLNSLKDSGNDLLVFIPNVFNENPFCSENELKNNNFSKQLNKEISEFNPDLVITFNYATYNKLLDCISCPIIIWDADLYPLWNQVDFIKKNVDKFTFFCFSRFGIKYASDFFNIKKSKIFHMASATNLRSFKVKKDVNISFIGTYFGLNYIISEYIKACSGSKVLFEIMNLIRNNPFISQKEIFKTIKSKKSDKVSKFKEIDEKFYSGFFSSENRINTLNNICDLGLSLYGDEGWLNIVDILPSLGACFAKEKIYSAKGNEDLYNRSKICININHSQSINGMPWRICDIMATSGCLISSYAPFIGELFKKYVKIPMYNNHYEARELCIKLLKDDVWRKEIVEGSNLAIKTEHRWDHRFKQMQEILGIQLINHDKKGNLKILEPKKSLLKKLTRRTFYIAIDKVKISKSITNKSIEEKKPKNKDCFHFRTKIWPKRRLDIKIKRIKPNE